jgi:hypothetical protein
LASPRSSAQGLDKLSSSAGQPTVGGGAGWGCASLMQADRSGTVGGRRRAPGQEGCAGPHHLWGRGLGPGLASRSTPPFVGSSSAPTKTAARSLRTKVPEGLRVHLRCVFSGGGALGLSGASAKKGTVAGLPPEHCTQRNPSPAAFQKAAGNMADPPLRRRAASAGLEPAREPPSTGTASAAQRRPPVPAPPQHRAPHSR